MLCFTWDNFRYLQEFTSLGTAGGIYHFRDQIQSGCPDYFFILNADVCCDYQLEEILEFHKSHITSNIPDIITMMTTEATAGQSLHFGCAVVDKQTNEVNIFFYVYIALYLNIRTIFEYETTYGKRLTPTAMGKI